MPSTRPCISLFFHPAPLALWPRGCAATLRNTEKCSQHILECKLYIRVEVPQTPTHAHTRTHAHTSLAHTHCCWQVSRKVQVRGLACRHCCTPPLPLAAIAAPRSSSVALASLSLALFMSCLRYYNELQHKSTAQRSAEYNATRQCDNA